MRAQAAALKEAYREARGEAEAAGADLAALRRAHAELQSSVSGKRRHYAWKHNAGCSWLLRRAMRLLDHSARLNVQLCLWVFCRQW